MHLTGALIGAIVIGGLVLAYVVSKAEMWVPITVIGLVGAAGYYALTRPAAPKAAPAQKAVTHVITHVVTRPGKPALSGTDIVLILVAGLVVVLVIALNRKGN